MKLSALDISDMADKDEKIVSYKLTTKQEASASTSNAATAAKPSREPAIKTISLSEMPAPPPPSAPSSSSAPSSRTSIGTKEQPGLIKKLMTFLFDKKEQEVTSESRSASTSARPNNRPRPPMRHHKGGGNRNFHNRGRRGRGRSNNGEQRNFDNREQRPKHQQHRTPDQQRDTTPRSDAKTEMQSRPVAAAHEADQRPTEQRQQQTQPSNQAATTGNMNTQAPRVVEQQLRPIETHNTPTPNLPVTRNDAEMREPRSETANIAATGTEPTGGQAMPGEKTERKSRSHYNSRRNKHFRNRHRNDQGKRQGLEGEDIYSKSKNETEE